MFISAKKLSNIRKTGVHKFLKYTDFLKDNFKAVHTPKIPFLKSTIFPQLINERL
jgi:hypothetical protein